MIVAHLLGGPKDGDVLALSEIAPALLCPVLPLPIDNATLPVGGEADFGIVVGTYRPDYNSQKDCECHPLCPHSSIRYVWRETP